MRGFSLIWAALCVDVLIVATADSSEGGVGTTVVASMGGGVGAGSTGGGVGAGAGSVGGGVGSTC